MKKTLITSLALLFVISASAVVGGPDPGEGELAITSSGSSASGSTAVGPNGTEYSSKVAMNGRSSNISIGDKIENISFSENQASFNGYIQAPTPCHTLDQETEKVGDAEHMIDIQTVVENSSTQCVQQVVMINYDANFEAETPYTLEVRHNNQTIDTIEAEDTSNPDPKDTRKKGMLSGLMNWFRNLF